MPSQKSADGRASLPRNSAHRGPPWASSLSPKSDLWLERACPRLSVRRTCCAGPPALRSSGAATAPSFGFIWWAMASCC